MAAALGQLRTLVRNHTWLSAGALVLISCGVCAAAYQFHGHRQFQTHLREAHRALDRHEWTAARSHVLACLNRKPDDPQLHLLAAKACRRAELPALAEEHLNACDRLLGPSTMAVRVERALLGVHLGNLSSEEAFLRDRVAQGDPEAVEILDILSAAMILHYRPDDAQKCLDELLKLQPDHFHALVRRAWTAQTMTRYPEAIGFLQHALALRADADTVRLSLAELQTAMGRFADARPHLENLRERQPDNASVLFGLARCQAAQGEPAQALALLDRVLAAQPGDWKALGERGNVTMQLERPVEAESYFRRALDLAPPDLTLLIRFTDCLRLVGKNDEALLYRKKADQLKADFERAEVLGKRIHGQEPNNPSLRHELGTVLLRIGKTEDAVRWFSTALEKDPQYRPAHQALAEFYERAGDAARAAPHRQALESSHEVRRGAPER